MSDEKKPVEVTSENLEALTNQLEGDGEFDTPASEAAPETTEPVVEGEAEAPPKEAEPESAPVKPDGQAEEFTLSDDEKEFLKELRDAKELAETPFKKPADLVRGYKSLQKEFTHDRERIKQNRQFLDRIERDPQFKQYVEQLQAMVDNPALAQAYAQKYQGEDLVPDPLQYDLSDPEQHKKFLSDQTAWMQRNVNSVINSRLGQVEQQTRMKGLEAEFRAKFPEIADPTSLLDWAQENVPKLNPFEAAYRLREWDNLPSKIEAKVRKELATQLETASKQKTPQGTTTKQETSATEILQYIGKYGPTAAYKRFGEANVEKVLQLSTME